MSSDPAEASVAGIEDEVAEVLTRLGQGLFLCEGNLMIAPGFCIVVDLLGSWA